MKQMFKVLFFLFLFGCGTDIDQLKDCYDGCQKQETEADRDRVVYVPVPGPAGKDGVDGRNGHNAVIEFLDAPSCINGGKIFLTAIDTNENDLLDTEDTNIKSVTICNGLNGSDGSKGEKGDKGDAGATGPQGPAGQSSPYLPVELLNPCGDASEVYDEILVRLYDGTILASFSDKENGQNTRFSIVGPGSYKTTDGDACYFTIDASGNLTNQHH